MRAGKLDRRIEIQKRAPLTHASPIGERVDSWETVATVWAEDVTNKRRGRAIYDNGIESSEIGNVFAIRYRDDIEANMRVVHEGKPYRILYTPQEGMGRYDSLLLACEARVADET